MTLTLSKPWNLRDPPSAILPVTDAATEIAAFTLEVPFPLSSTDHYKKIDFRGGTLGALFQAIYDVYQEQVTLDEMKEIRRTAEERTILDQALSFLGDLGEPVAHHAPKRIDCDNGQMSRFCRIHGGRLEVSVDRPRPP